MLKRTLFFGNPAYLSTKNEQLVVELKETHELKTVPIEDIGILVIEHPHITLTHTLISKLLEHNVAIVTCNQRFMPTGLMLNLDGHSHQTRVVRAQVEAPQPLKKQLWQKIVAAKIVNQSLVLKSQKLPDKYLAELSKTVRSGDANNHEAKAAQYYWKHYLTAFPVDNIAHQRSREGDFPNPWLNYGYAILRATVARSLVGSGLLPVLGIHHKNAYNSYGLADDVMEPYRPFIDHWVLQVAKEFTPSSDTPLPKEVKKKLLQIPVLDVIIKKERRPLMIAVQQTTASLSKSFLENEVRLQLPVLPH